MLEFLNYIFVDVEDGHTLHLIVRQPVVPSPDIFDHPGLVWFRIVFKLKFDLTGFSLVTY